MRRTAKSRRRPGKALRRTAKRSCPVCRGFPYSPPVSPDFRPRNQAIQAILHGMSGTPDVSVMTARWTFRQKVVQWTLGATHVPRLSRQAGLRARSGTVRTRGRPQPYISGRPPGKGATQTPRGHPYGPYPAGRRAKGSWTFIRCTPERPVRDSIGSARRDGKRRDTRLCHWGAGPSKEKDPGAPVPWHRGGTGVRSVRERYSPEAPGTQPTPYGGPGARSRPKPIEPSVRRCVSRPLRATAKEY